MLLTALRWLALLPGSLLAGTASALLFGGLHHLFFPHTDGLLHNARDFVFMIVSNYTFGFMSVAAASVICPPIQRHRIVLMIVAIFVGVSGAAMAADETRNGDIAGAFQLACSVFGAVMGFRVYAEPPSESSPRPVAASAYAPR